MKSKFYLSVFVVAACFLQSCIFKIPKPIKTKEDTTNALIGSWKPENEDSKIEAMYFVEDYCIIVYRIPGDLKITTGSWKYMSVGKIQIEAPNNGDIKLSSDIKLILNDKEVYKKVHSKII